MVLYKTAHPASSCINIFILFSLLHFAFLLDCGSARASIASRLNSWNLTSHDVFDVNTSLKSGSKISFNDLRDHTDLRDHYSDHLVIDIPKLGPVNYGSKKRRWAVKRPTDATSPLSEWAVKLPNIEDVKGNKISVRDCVDTQPSAVLQQSLGPVLVEDTTEPVWEKASKCGEAEAKEKLTKAVGNFYCVATPITTGQNQLMCWKHFRRQSANVDRGCATFTCRTDS